MSKEVFLAFHIYEPECDPATIDHFGIYLTLEKAIKKVKEEGMSTFTDYIDADDEEAADLKPDEYQSQEGELIYCMSFNDGRERFCVERHILQE